MERLRPLDLEKAKFQLKFRGYEKAAVDQLLAKAAKEIETLLGECQHAKETAEQALSELERFRAQETLMKEALMIAQKAADETRANAHKEADLIEQEARQRGQDLERQAKQQIHDMRWEIERLSLERQKFEQRLRGLLDEHQRLLDAGRPYQPALVNLELAEETPQPSEPETAAG